MGFLYHNLLDILHSSSDYTNIIKGGSILTEIFTKRGFSIYRLKHAFKTFYGRQQDLIGKYDRSISAIAKDLLGG